MIFDFGKVNVKDEFIAALTVFLASSYILFINPSILSDAGMDFDGAFFATAIAAALGTLLMALIANKPYLIAPGMTLSIFFSYTMLQTYRITWQIALAASLFVGVILLVLSLSKIRVWFVEAIPPGLRFGIVGGIGLLLVSLGFAKAHIIVPSVFHLQETIPFPFVSLGNMLAPQTLLALFGLFITGLLLIRKIRGAFLFGILATTIIHLAVLYLTGSTVQIPIPAFPHNLTTVALQADVYGLMQSNHALSIVLALFVVAFFDTIGTATALLIKGGHTAKGKIKDLDKVMISDSLATIFGAGLGTSPQMIYAESASAYDAGGKTGLTAIFICIFFILSLFLIPFIKLVPVEATAPVLIIVGLLMLGAIKNIDVQNYSESIPAFFCLAAIPFTFSISHGIGLAVIMYVILKIFAGNIKDVHPGMYLTALLFLLDFLGVFK